VFIPDSAFDVIVIKQIRLIYEPVLKCLKSVVDELSIALNQCTARSTTRYPRLFDEAEKMINTHLRKCEKKCIEQLMDRIEDETYYLNTKHEDFLNL
jgi:dynamin 1/3